MYAYSFSIDGHKLCVIATDGHFIRPVDVDYLIVHSGERYDVILEANQEVRNYWIRAETLEVLPPDVEHSARAILKYGTNETDIDFNWRTGSVPETPLHCTDNDPCDVLNCPFLKYPVGQHKNCIKLTSLHPLSSSPSTAAPCKGYENGKCTSFFNFGFEGISVTSAINGKNFKLPVTPYQTNCNRYDSDRGDCMECSDENARKCRCIHVESIMRFDRNNVRLQIMVFSAVGVERLREFAHPVHLHGHSFHILHIGYGNYSDSNALTGASMDVQCNGRLCTNPMWHMQAPDEVVVAVQNIDTRILKDTVIVPAGGYVAQQTSSSTATLRSTSWRAWAY